MADENQNVGAGAGAGDAGSQQQSSSQQQATIDDANSKLLQLLEGKLTERFDGLAKNLTGQLSGLQKVQGEIDRSRNEFKQRLEQLNKLTKAGLSQDEAIAQLERQEAEQSKYEALQKEVNDLKSLIKGNGNGQQQPKVAEVFSQYGLDLKDSRVAPALSKTYGNDDEIKFAALALFHQLQTSPNPNAAQQPTMQGGSGRTDAKDISQINDSSSLYNLAAKDLLGG